MALFFQRPLSSLKSFSIAGKEEEEEEEATNTLAEEGILALQGVRGGREKKQQKFMIIVMECLENVREKRKETATADFFLDCDHEKDALSKSMCTYSELHTQHSALTDKHFFYSSFCPNTSTVVTRFWLLLVVFRTIGRKFQSFNPLLFSSEISSLPLPLRRHVPNSGRRRRRGRVPK